MKYRNKKKNYVQTEREKKSAKLKLNYWKRTSFNSRSEANRSFRFPFPRFPTPGSLLNCYFVTRNSILDQFPAGALSVDPSIHPFRLSHLVCFRWCYRSIFSKSLFYLILHFLLRIILNFFSRSFSIFSFSPVGFSVRIGGFFFSMNANFPITFDDFSPSFPIIIW